MKLHKEVNGEKKQQNVLVMQKKRLIILKTELIEGCQLKNLMLIICTIKMLMRKEDFRLKQVCIRIQEMGATICGLTE